MSKYRIVKQSFYYAIQVEKMYERPGEFYWEHLGSYADERAARMALEKIAYASKGPEVVYEVEV